MDHVILSANVVTSVTCSAGYTAVTAGVDSPGPTATVGVGGVTQILGCISCGAAGYSVCSIIA